MYFVALIILLITQILPKPSNVIYPHFITLTECFIMCVMLLGYKSSQIPIFQYSMPISQIGRFWPRLTKYRCPIFPLSSYQGILSSLIFSNFFVEIKMAFYTELQSFIQIFAVFTEQTFYLTLHRFVPFHHVNTQRIFFFCLCIISHFFYHHLLSYIFFSIYQLDCIEI